jgi:phosphonate transport system permease protein
VTETAAPPVERHAPVRPSRPGPSWPLIGGLIVAAAITVWAADGINFTVRPLWEDLDRGREILRAFLDPEWAHLDRIWDRWLETLSIAVVATLVGCLFGLVGALLASKVSSPNAPTYWVAKQVLSVIRSLPDVAYALLFVVAVGTGPLAGVLALVFFNLGIIAKLTSETIDATDPGPVEAADAVGAGRIERARAAIVPQVLPNYLSYCLYVFELNVRASVILGYVGAGGIGQEIRYLLGLGSWNNGYGKLSAVIIAVFVVVLALDTLSRYLRRRLV